MGGKRKLNTRKNVVTKTVVESNQDILERSLLRKVQDKLKHVEEMTESTTPSQSQIGDLEEEKKQHVINDFNSETQEKGKDDEDLEGSGFETVEKPDDSLVKSMGES